MFPVTASPPALADTILVPDTLSPTFPDPAWKMPDEGALEKEYIGADTLPFVPSH